MKLSEMKECLQSRDIRLTKSLGQNFLYDPNLLSKIADAAEIQPGENVLEIGPGLGPLTQALLDRGAEVWAIEKDARLVAILKERYDKEPRLRLQHADALDVLHEEGRDWTHWKVVSNLPYSIGTPLVVDLAQAPEPPSILVVTLQLEVIRRLKAGVGSKDYGVLSLLVQCHFQYGTWFKVPRNCFYPQPDVDSGCIVLHRRARELISRDRVHSFVKVVKRAFSQRRKILWKLLKADWPEDRIHAARETLGLSETIRGEALSLEQFIVLTELLG